jgi:uncharacterized protein YndB with AHSA1/START domain
MNQASLLKTGDQPTLRFERHLQRPIGDVWRALTDPAELKAWFPCDIVDPRWEAGAALTFSFADHPELELTGTVLEVDAPNALAFRWGDDALRFELTARADGSTDLVLIDQLPAGIAARNAAGWDVCLDRLALGDRADGAWKPRFDLYTAAFEPELGPQEGPPAGFEEG